ncbi:hypothetical protein Q4F19_03240 [Sphingomonas sp. BIUV-7]|uniref:Uncharacterized protein n=1 Tax=Sphingomonas natans TaxID=3063330 RepID=A0ABT8Y4Z8_9SPHN|nr:hypothetical protein [Sphingomonas sp. BIUV-7]MDO6413388.1 hypothetical protein [Sphingomonas sp. BIUV-7]
MSKPILMAALCVVAPLVATLAPAQAPRVSPGTACPAGTRFTTIRHNMIKPGQWAAFEQAVAAHNRWYATHKDKTATKLARVIALGGGGPALSTNEAVTVTVYSGAPQPAHDADWDAFTAKYRASSEVKDEARICMP